MKHAKAFLIFSILFASIVVVTLISVTSAATATTTVAAMPQLPSFDPLQGLRMSTSTNWAGYAVGVNLFGATENKTVTDVSGSWVVPAVNMDTTPVGLSVCWVGIDGYSSATVEQIGTTSDALPGATATSGSVPVYAAWYEMYPRAPVEINMNIYPGDTMWGDVRFIGNGMFLLTIADLTQQELFMTIKTMPGADRSSAEWIVELPGTGSGPAPLADFGKVTFTDAQVTLNGQTGSINNQAWQHDAINMVDSANNTMALTSKLTWDGSGFKVTWVQSGLEY